MADVEGGELEEGEVLTSDEEEGDQGEGEGGEGAEGTHALEKTEEKAQEEGPVAGTKQPALDSEIPNPKAIKLDPTLQNLTAAASNSDAEEGEIFSDDEEAAYFPQLIKSRSTRPHGSQERESEASGSDAAEERKKFSHARGISSSPERDSFRSRKQRSRERERDNEPKSLATLFFEDRDGTRGDLSDDGKEGHGERKGDQSRHSGSPNSRSSRERGDRDRDRDRTRDRDKRDRNYSRSKDRGRNRDRDRDQDSNVDSSEEESSWSQRGSRFGKGYQPYQRGGRKGNYQSKYGQKHDRFGGAMGSDTRGTGGRQGGRENSQQSNWNPGPGRMMTAQQCQALAENFRKRREKGLPLLQTPKIKPTDNLDQFNYPAPPSWYLEAVENWEKMHRESATVSNQVGQAQPTTLQVHVLAPIQTQLPAGITDIVGAEQMVRPPPLFPPSTQFVQPLNPTNTSIFGGPPPGLPCMPGQVANLALPIPVQAPSLFPPTSGPVPCKPLFVPLPNTALSVVPPGSQLIAAQGDQQGSSLAVVGVEKEEERAVVSTVKAVNVSSLALNVSSAEEEEDMEDEGRMKIALETPTPQPDADSRRFTLFQTVATEHNERTITEEVPGLTKADDNMAEKESRDVEKMETSEACDVTVNKETQGEEMEVGASPDKGKNENSSISPDLDLEVMAAVPPPIAPVVAPADPSFSSKASPTIVKAIPPVQLTTPSETKLKGTENHFAVKNRVESDHDEDFDYDKYLDQLDEEEEGEDMIGPSLVGTLRSSLLKNNPLDEDFPAINPVNESQASRNGSGEGGSLRSLVRESLGSNGKEGGRFPTKAKGPKGKSVHHRQSQAEWPWNNRQRIKNSRNLTTTSPVVRPCKFYLDGFCKYGDECQYRHDGPRYKKKAVCKFYLQDSCMKGEDCLYYHSAFPCKFFHTNTVCKHGDNCKFSHEALTEETRELLAQVLEPTRNAMKQAELAALGIGDTTPLSPPTNSTSFKTPHHEGIPLLHRADPQVRVHFFSSRDPSSDTVAMESQSPSLTSSLLISIPNHILDKALVVSIPRQKLGPPFGTVPISAPSVPPNQTSMLSPSLPPSVPQASMASFAPQSSQPFHPPIHQPSTPLPVLPIQSLPPGKFPVSPRNFPMPPRPNQPPANLPPQPSGWQTLSDQPIPLFPPNVGPPKMPPNAPSSPAHIPPGQPPPSNVPPQYHLPPSERKGLLPTPPSHLRIDPKNIQWSDDEPEYWEAPEVTQQSGRFAVPITHPPPQFGSSGLPPGPFRTPPPPPHGPQAINSATQQPPFHPQQQLVATRMDPRQNRMEPRPGGDPRRGGGGGSIGITNLQQGTVGTGDPRQHMSGAQMDTTRPVPYPVPLGPVPPSQPPMQGQGFQVPPGQQRQWPQHPPPHIQQPMPQPHSAIPPFPAHAPNPIPPSSSITSGIPPGSSAQLPSGPQALGTGHFITGINPDHFQPPTSSQPTDKGPKSIMWGSDLAATAANPSSLKGPRDDALAASEAQPLRVDPRTKYSHFKIKPKGSPSASSPPISSSILKGKESGGSTDQMVVGSGDRTNTTHMPKLLQQPPPQQRPFDPHELFDSAASKEVPSDYQVSGPFGSTFGSYFTRSSEAAESAGKIPYGEITITNVRTDTESVADPNKEEQVRTTKSVDQKEQAIEDDRKSDETKKTVPPYLAELGVGIGESDLTIDSAFSSLDKKDAGQEEGGGQQKTAITAKKLPSIFSFGSGAL